MTIQHTPETTSASDSGKGYYTVVLTVKEREALLRTASPANGLASIVMKLQGQPWHP